MSNIYGKRFINQELQEKVRNVDSAMSSFNVFSKESRGIIKEVFFQIALIAGGAISLSVTFVGYLYHLPDFNVCLITGSRK